MNDFRLLSQDTLAALLCEHLADLDDQRTSDEVTVERILASCASNAAAFCSTAGSATIIRQACARLGTGWKSLEGHIISRRHDPNSPA